MGSLSRRVGGVLIASALVSAFACGKSDRHTPGGSGNRAGAGGSGGSKAGHGGSAGSGAGRGGSAGHPQAGDSPLPVAGRSGSGTTGGDGGAPEGGSDARGGEAGHGGATGGAAGQAAGHAGAGDGGTGEGGASASQCHADPDLTPALPSTLALDPDLVARAAAVWGSCNPDDGVDRNAFGIWAGGRAAPRIYYRLGEQLDCLAHANCGCDAVEHCFDWRADHVDDDCTIGCDGSEWTDCAPTSGLPGFYRWRLDCARFGLTCDDDAGCVDEAPVACSVFDTTCTAGGAVESCDDGFLQHTPACAEAGLACEGGACTGAGAACDDSLHFPHEEVIDFYGTGCSDDTLEICANGKSSTVDCTTQGQGFHCQHVDDAYFCGLGAECVPPVPGEGSPRRAECDGTVLSFCNMGRIDHVDCTSLGFTGCDIDSSVAHYGCTPVPSDP